MPADVDPFTDDAYNLLLRNEPGVPSTRQLQRYIGTPFRVYDVLAVSDPMARARAWTRAEGCSRRV